MSELSNIFADQLSNAATRQMNELLYYNGYRRYTRMDYRVWNYEQRGQPSRSVPAAQYSSAPSSNPPPPAARHGRSSDEPAGSTATRVRTRSSLVRNRPAVTSPRSAYAPSGMSDRPGSSAAPVVANVENRPTVRPPPGPPPSAGRDFPSGGSQRRPERRAPCFGWFARRTNLVEGNGGQRKGLRQYSAST